MPPAPCADGDAPAGAEERAVAAYVHRVEYDVVRFYGGGGGGCGMAAGWLARGWLPVGSRRPYAVAYAMFVCTLREYSARGVAGRRDVLKYEFCYLSPPRLAGSKFPIYAEQPAGAFGVDQPNLLLRGETGQWLASKSRRSRAAWRRGAGGAQPRLPWKSRVLYFCVLGNTRFVCVYTY